jgi:E3 SUMO-protein ligase RanBP2
LFDLLQAELAVRPGDAHINIKLVQLFSSDGRLEEAVKHCLATEKRGLLRSSLDWYSTVVHTLQVSRMLTKYNYVLMELHVQW